MKYGSVYSKKFGVNTNKTSNSDSDSKEKMGFIMNNSMSSHRMALRKVKDASGSARSPRSNKSSISDHSILHGSVGS